LLPSGAKIQPISTLRVGTVMTSATQIVLSGALTFGVPLVLAIRDLITLRRDPGGSWPPSPPPQTPPPAPRTGSPPIRRELPACLIPVRLPEDQVKVRLREFA
jgi:hypothetical protein